jgi:hypothetical protein
MTVNGSPPWVAVLIFASAYLVITAPKLRLPLLVLLLLGG